MTDEALRRMQAAFPTERDTMTRKVRQFPLGGRYRRPKIQREPPPDPINRTGLIEVLLARDGGEEFRGGPALQAGAGRGGQQGPIGS